MTKGKGPAEYMLQHQEDFRRICQENTVVQTAMMMRVSMSAETVYEIAIVALAKQNDNLFSALKKARELQCPDPDKH